MSFPTTDKNHLRTGGMPLPLAHTWPLWDRSLRFDLGIILSSAVTDVLKPANAGELGLHHAGCWECDLTDNSLHWSGGVYDIFGLPRDTFVRRDEALAYYGDESRAKMECLRAYSLKHQRGFTVDVEIRAATGNHRWMRLIAEPVCSNGSAIRLQGLKLII